MSSVPSTPRIPPQPIAIIPTSGVGALLDEKPWVQHLWTRCQDSGAFSRIIVATDSERVVSTVQGFGGEAQLVSAPSRGQSHTERVADVARAFSGPLVFLNVPADEPLIHPAMLSQLARAFADPTVQMATLVRPLDELERTVPDIVKVAMGVNGNALYFSRADIPAGKPSVERFAHIRLYGYRRETLLKLAALRPTPLEDAEGLEPLRALENGISIRCLVTQFNSLAEQAFLQEDPQVVSERLTTSRRI